MISGIKILLLALIQAQTNQAPDASALISRLARPAPASTAYTEVRFVHLLRKPVVLHGVLDYGGADRLGKRVEQPYRETMQIADGAVDVLRDGRPPQHFSLDRAPELQALLGGFSALLGGDAAALGKVYTITVVENATSWTLTLTPRNAELAKHLREIVVDGAGNEPGCFSLHQANGDASVMLLGDRAAVTFSEPATLPALDAICRRTAP